MNTDMVHSMTLMSGSVMSPMAVTKTPRVYAQGAAAAVGCPTTPTSALVNCMKTIDAQKLTNAIELAYPGATRGPVSNDVSPLKNN